MEKILHLDKQGRLYIPEDIRKRIKFNVMVARVLNEGIFLKPLGEDPVDALGRLGSKKLKGKSVDKLKREARKDIEKNADEKIC